ncbi:MAG: hypothetical protein V9F82_08940 [Dermatophilaceae bacterium]
MKVFQRVWPFALLAAILGVFPLVAPEAIVDIGVYALIYGLAAIGLSLLMGLAGQVSLGHAAFFAVGAYTQAIFLTKTSVPGPISAVVAILLVEQNVRAAFKIADRVLVMDRGKIIATGTPAELASDERVRAAYLGGSSNSTSSVAAQPSPLPKE